MYKERLSIKEIHSILKYYHAQFPAWRVIRDDTLAREAGPVLQGITFDRLSGGVYRPTGYIRVLVAPSDFWGYEIVQNLNIRVRQISRRSHEQLRDKVVESIRAEFNPNMDRPLDAEDVLTIYEQRAFPNNAEAYSLAALNAFLGHNARALEWCSRFTDLINDHGRSWQDIDIKRQGFLDELEKWLRLGDVKRQLERVLHEERRKWNLMES